MITGGDSCLGLKISFNSLQNIDFTSCCTEGTRAEDPILTSVQFIVQQLGSQMEDKMIRMHVAWKTAWIRKKKSGKTVGSTTHFVTYAPSGSCSIKLEFRCSLFVSSPGRSKDLLLARASTACANMEALKIVSPKAHKLGIQ